MAIVLTHDWVVMHLNGGRGSSSAAALARGGVPTPDRANALRLPSALATIAMSSALGAVAAIGGYGRHARVRHSRDQFDAAVVGRLAIMDALSIWPSWPQLVVSRARAAVGGALDGRRPLAFVFGTAALAFGTLAKGPVAPAIVVLIAVVWLAWERRAGTRVVLPSAASIAAALALFALVVLPWFVAESVRVGPQAAAELIGHYTIGRYTGVIENQTGPWWYYFPVLILGFFPWIAFLPVAVLRPCGARSRRRPRLRDWRLLGAVPFVFSASPKRPAELRRALFPALAILTARTPRRRRCATVARCSSRRRRCRCSPRRSRWPAIFSRTNAFELGGLLPQLAVLGAIVLAGGIVALVAFGLARTQRSAPFVLAAAGAAILLFLAQLAQAGNVERLKPMPSVARKIQAQRAPGATVAIRTVSGANGLAYYTSPGVVTIDDSEMAYRRLICTTPDLYVVTRATEAPQLKAWRRAGPAHQRPGAVRVTALHVDGPGCRPAS